MYVMKNHKCLKLHQPLTVRVLVLPIISLPFISLSLFLLLFPTLLLSMSFPVVGLLMLLSSNYIVSC